MAAAGPDRELDELLDSALSDFEKTKPVPPPVPAAGARDACSSEKLPGDAAQEKFFQDLFDSELASQATAEFEKAMKELAEEEPHLVEQFQKLSEAAGRVGSDTTSQQEFTSCLKETLSGLAKNANDLQNSSMSEEELAKAMEGLGLEEGDGEGNILPIMQSIMQNLLSKDVLYPSLKEITEKYPEWLRSHRDTLPEEQFEKYQEQHSIMGKICQQFEAEQAADSDAEQKARFEMVLDLMQQLQDLGHPPKELAGESPPGLNFDLDGLNLSDTASAGDKGIAEDPTYLDFSKAFDWVAAGTLLVKSGEMGCAKRWIIGLEGGDYWSFSRSALEASLIQSLW
ncbi:peroxisomal biogenesis factor 19 isoform X2 [Dermochelys coriacea]|uniref:peroxisomal biogenesis factor 19 isoform X2 n=1 Tax=Dermochelys coriacea TaxID=27794 RepID=UPI001CA84122|nr:peroxisomal biogenesis factor 19 isoform X2 [Dermochelys coriacea]